MFIGSWFSGDENKALMNAQHDLYFRHGNSGIEVDGKTLDSCIYLFWMSREAVLTLTEKNPLFFPEREKLPEVEQFDHRVLQNAHDIMAAYFRWTTIGFKKPAFCASDQIYYGYLWGFWKYYLSREVSDLTFSNVGFAEYVCKSVLFENTQNGYEAEENIENWLYSRYGNDFTLAVKSFREK